MIGSGLAVARATLGSSMHASNHVDALIVPPYSCSSPVAAPTARMVGIDGSDRQSRKAIPSRTIEGGVNMRRARGALLPPIRAERIRRRDLYAALRGAVLDHTVRAGERLPSSRAVAS